MDNAFGCFYSSLTFLCYQPQKNVAKFFAMRILQTATLTMIVLLAYFNRDAILYQKDIFGCLADYNKLLMSFFVSLVILLEPMVRFRDYQEMEILSQKFCASLKSLRHKIDVEFIYSQMRRRLIIGIAFYFLSFMCSELIWILTSLDSSQSRWFYAVFIMPYVIHQLKTLQHVIYLMFIGSEMKILKLLVREVNQDVTLNRELKSKALDKIIHRRYQKVLSMYENVMDTIKKLNSSIGISQLAMLNGARFYLIGDFYWIAFSYLHLRVEAEGSYS